MKKLLILPLLASFSLAEPSAFEAGNLDSDTPYGLTKDEKYIWQNKQDIKKLKELIAKQAQQIKEQKKIINKLKLSLLNYKMQIDILSQRVSGIESLMPAFDDLSILVHNIKKEVSNIKNDNNQTKVKLENLQSDLDELKNIVDINKQNSDKNMQVIISLIEELAKKIDKIEIQKKSTQINFNQPKSKLLDEAIKYYKQLKFAKAQKIFNYLYKVKANIKIKTPALFFYI